MGGWVTGILKSGAVFPPPPLYLGVNKQASHCAASLQLLGFESCVVLVLIQCFSHTATVCIFTESLRSGPLGCVCRRI